MGIRINPSSKDTLKLWRLCFAALALFGLSAAYMLLPPKHQAAHTQTTLPKLTLEFNRKGALAPRKAYYETPTSIWEASLPKQWTPAHLTIDSISHNVLVRLRGRWATRLRGTRLDLSVKLPHTQWRGMDKWTLTNPQSIGGFSAWIWRKILAEEQLLSPPLDWLTLQVNHEYLGLYAYEAHPRPILLDAYPTHHKGLFFRWLCASKESCVPQQAQFILENDSSVYKKPHGRQWIKEAKQLMHGYLRAEIPAHQVFAVDAWAKYWAWSEILGAHTQKKWQTQMFFFDADRHRIFPVAQRGFARLDSLVQLPLWLNTGPQNGYAAPFWKNLFLNSFFYEAYATTLFQYSDTAYLRPRLTQLFQANEGNIRRVQRDFPKAYWPATQILQRATALRQNWQRADASLTLRKLPSSTGSFWVEAYYQGQIPLRFIGLGLARDSIQEFFPAQTWVHPKKDQIAFKSEVFSLPPFLFYQIAGDTTWHKKALY